MEPAEYDNIARLETIHWWYRGMAAISVSLLASRVGANTASLRILDAGCGPGGMFPHLARFGQPFGLDSHPRALHHARGRAPLAQASVEQLPFESASFDLVTCFDVIYHRAIENDVLALRELGRVLRPGGTLLLRVPAFEALRGPHDTVVHTRRRYTARELRHKIIRAGLTPQRLTYANLLLAPLVFAARRFAPNHQPASDVQLPAPGLNAAFEAVLRFESVLLRAVSLPFGVSVFALASRPPEPA